MKDSTLLKIALMISWPVLAPILIVMVAIALVVTWPLIPFAKITYKGVEI